MKKKMRINRNNNQRNLTYYNICCMLKMHSDDGKGE